MCAYGDGLVTVRGVDCSPTALTRTVRRCAALFACSRINGQPTKPIGGKYLPLYQPRDASHVGQVALSERAVSTHFRDKLASFRTTDADF